MRLVFICQAVDRDDPVLATTIRWIETLAAKPAVEHVTALALRVGRHELPGNVEVRRFGRSNRPATLLAFYRAVAAALRRARPDCFFIYMGGPYPALLMPFKLLLRIPIVQWKAHAAVTRAMAFYARRCDDLVFTAARASFPVDLPTVRVVGHGIDTTQFAPEEGPPLGDLVAIGRVAPVKRIEPMVKAVAHANRELGASYRLDVYGPVFERDTAHAARITELIRELGEAERIGLRGTVPQERLPAILGGYRACLNFSTGAIDKSVLEAMACGLPVLSTNDSAAEIMPAELRPLLVADAQSTELQAQAIHALLERPEAELAEVGRRLRALVQSEHGVDRLFDRILEDVRALVARRA